MKRIILSLSVVLFSLSIMAQPGQRPDPETRAKERTKRMKEVIQFSDEQEKKVYDLNLEFTKKRRELFENRTGDREEMREKMDVLNKEYDEKLKKILDEKQFKKYEEEKDNLRQRPPRDGGGGGGN